MLRKQLTKTKMTREMPFQLTNCDCKGVLKVSSTLQFHERAVTDCAFYGLATNNINVPCQMFELFFYSRQARQQLQECMHLTYVAPSM